MVANAQPVKVGIVVSKQPADLLQWQKKKGRTS
jgi:hypothetical protein